MKDRRHSGIRDLAAGIAARALACWLRVGPGRRLRRWLWRNIADRRLNWRGLRLVARTRFGTRMICRLDDAVQGRIFHFGVWEPHASAAIAGRLAPGDLFVDVGANVGYYSLLAAARGAEVVAIEASPSIHEMLLANLALNPALADRIRTCRVAVSDHEGEVVIHRAGDDNLGASTILAERARQDGMTAEGRVPTRRLADILDEAERARVRLVKIDIEGAEYPVLRDIFSHRHEWPGTMEIVVEISADALASHGLRPSDLFARIRRAGYRIMRIRNRYDMADLLDRIPPVPPVEITGWPEGEDLCDLLLSPGSLRPPAAASASEACVTNASSATTAPLSAAASPDTPSR